jgi:hypothetical protein
MIVFLGHGIKAWSWGVSEGSILCIFKACPCCGGRPDAFKVHDRPKRWFWVVVKEAVQKIRGLVIQWKCPLCLGTFRQLPDWAEPHKRYITETIVGLCREYLEVDKIGYRGVADQVHWDQGGRRKGSGISHVTLWRWVTALGKRTRSLAKARSLIRQKDPNCPIFRELVDVPKRKYRSQARRGVLIRAKQLLRTARVYLQVLGVPLFHEFGTAQG